MNASTKCNILNNSSRDFGHETAITLGLVLMLIGLSLGVTIVALPFGLVVGGAGLAIALWGLAVSTRDGLRDRGVGGS